MRNAHLCHIYTHFLEHPTNKRNVTGAEEEFTSEHSLLKNGMIQK